MAGAAHRAVSADLLARVVLLDALARLAAHLAAPDEAAVTSAHSSYLLDVVAATTAQRLAALRSVRAALTSPPAGPGDPAGRVRSTVVGRAVDVDQVRLGDGLAPLAFLTPAQGRESAGRDGGRGGAAARVERPGGGSTARPGRYLDGVLILRLELVADLAERWDRSPARLDSTRPRHAVTTTLHLHRRRQHLQRRQRRRLTCNNYYTVGDSSRKKMDPRHYRLSLNKDLPDFDNFWYQYSLFETQCTRRLFRSTDGIGEVIEYNARHREPNGRTQSRGTT